MNEEKEMGSDVDAFLDDLEQKDPEKHEVMKALHQLVRGIHPEIEEGIKYGGVMFSFSADCGGLFASKHHVSFEFSDGKSMKDPEGMLEGSGKLRRHIKIKSLDDIDAKNVSYFVEQM